MAVRPAPLALVLALSCATSTPQEAERAAASARRERLEAFSAALAQAGMSVPVPPRLCEEPTSQAMVSFDDDIGCVSAPVGANDDDVVTVYARAIVARRVPNAEPRADALARAFLNGDAALATMAQTIEAEFDAKRLARKAKPSAKPKARPKKGAAAAAADVVDAGPARGGVERSVAVEREREPSDAGTLELADGGPVPLTVRERLIGTWATTKPGPIVHVHALCADGDWMVRYEATSDVGRMVVGDLEPIHGTWEVFEGDPPRITLTAGDGEKQEGTIGTLTDEVAELAIEGDDPAIIRVVRRAKTAVCD